MHINYQMPTFKNAIDVWLNLFICYICNNQTQKDIACLHLKNNLNQHEKK